MRRLLQAAGGRGAAHQAAQVSRARATTTGTNTAETRSAKAWMGALLICRAETGAGSNKRGSEGGAGQARAGNPGRGGREQQAGVEKGGAGQARAGTPRRAIEARVEPLPALHGPPGACAASAHLRRLHQAHNLGQRCVGAHARHAHAQRPPHVDGASNHRVAWALADGHCRCSRAGRMRGRAGPGGRAGGRGACTPSKMLARGAHGARREHQGSQPTHP